MLRLRKVLTNFIKYYLPNATLIKLHIFLLQKKILSKIVHPNQLNLFTHEGGSSSTRISSVCSTLNHQLDAARLKISRCFSSVQFNLSLHHFNVWLLWRGVGGKHKFCAAQKNSIQSIYFLALPSFLVLWLTFFFFLEFPRLFCLRLLSSLLYHASSCNSLSGIVSFLGLTFSSNGAYWNIIFRLD